MFTHKFQLLFCLLSFAFRRRSPLLLSHNMKYAGPLGLCPETTY